MDIQNMNLSGIGYTDSRQTILFRGLKLGAAQVCALGVPLVDLDIAISVVQWTETSGS